MTRVIVLYRLPDHVERKLDSFKTPITVFNPSIKGCPLIYANEAFEALTGHQRSEITGRDCNLLLSADPDSEAGALVREATQADTPLTLCLKGRRSDGTMFDSLLILRPIRMRGGSGLLLGCHHDRGKHAVEQKCRHQDWTIGKTSLDFQRNVVSARKIKRELFETRSDAIATQIESFFLRQSLTARRIFLTD